MADEAQTVFLSYASPDRDRVAPYANALESHGFSVWIDYKRLKAGQNWGFEIRRALDKAAIILVFISNNSVDRRGYVQREIKLTLDKAEEKLVSDIFIIPVILDEDTLIPDQIRHVQCVKAWEANHLASIIDAIDHQLSAIGTEVREAQDRASVSWSETKYKESWDGLPGYEAEFNLLQFSSIDHPHIGDITTLIRGRLIGLIMEQRRVKFEQNPDVLTFGKSKFFRTYTFDAHCLEPVVTGNIISIAYSVHHYTGGAHGNMFFRTFSFFLDPVVSIRSLEEIFIHGKLDVAFEIMQSSVREQLQSILITDTKDDTSQLWIDSIHNGTKDWDSFGAFLFGEKAIDIRFAPYEVAAYAYGPQTASVNYERIISFMRKEYVDALGIEGLLWAARRTEPNVASAADYAPVPTSHAAK